MTACLEKTTPKKLLSEVDKAIDSKNINKAYELVGCYIPDSDRIDSSPFDTRCEKCQILGVNYKGVDGHLVEYPKCVLRKYVYIRKELKGKITKERK